MEWWPTELFVMIHLPENVGAFISTKWLHVSTDHDYQICRIRRGVDLISKSPSVAITHKNIWVSILRHYRLNDRSTNSGRVPGSLKDIRSLWNDKGLFSDYHDQERINQSILHYVLDNHLTYFQKEPWWFIGLVTTIDAYGFWTIPSLPTDIWTICLL